ncbi:MAG: hypothetical protein HC922_02160 [Leptolyngbyaceae cyanobacterium SM2_3_12]|nr:hypothetical protein [Leptolyngbyaceae cyanobacterium SM2_3_12]
MKKILREGNEAQRWLHQYEAGQTVQEVLQTAIGEVKLREGQLAEELCEPCVA